MTFDARSDQGYGDVESPTQGLLRLPGQKKMTNDKEEMEKLFNEPIVSHILQLTISVQRNRERNIRNLCMIAYLRGKTIGILDSMELDKIYDKKDD